MNASNRRSRTRQTMIPTVRIPVISMAELLPPATSRPAMPVADADCKAVTQKLPVLK